MVVLPAVLLVHVIELVYQGNKLADPLAILSVSVYVVALTSGVIPDVPLVTVLPVPLLVLAVVLLTLTTVEPFLIAITNLLKITNRQID